MNKELISKISIFLPLIDVQNYDDDDNPFVTEECILDDDDIKEIIGLCADEAIDVICNIKPEFRSDLHEVFVRQAEKAIEKRMK